MFPAAQVEEVFPGSQTNILHNYGGVASMNKARRFLLLGAVVGVLAVLAVPLYAQDQTLGAGEGAPVVWPNFGGDPTNFNPILTNDGPSQQIANFLFPGFVGIDPQSGEIVEHAPGTIADSWTVSPDGTVYTFKLRTDFTWTDGTPVTAQDVKYAFDAIQSGKTNSPLAGNYDSVATLEAPDDHTVVVTFKEADCTALSALSTLPVVPSHTFTQLFGTDYAKMNDSDWNLNPTVTSGVFSFNNFRSGEQVTLAANQKFPDAPNGVIPQGFIQRQLANQTVVVDEFNAGNLTLIDSVPEDRQAEMDAKGAAGQVQEFKALGSGWQFLAFNLADPNNPQNGLDADGKPIDQGHHPLFGDVRVRQAVAYATNHDALNQGAFSGTGIPVSSPVVGNSPWYDKDLQPYSYDAQKAMQLLDQAGFIDDDNDPSTPRIAKGAMYAPDGTPLSFTITSFSGNTSVDSTLVLMQDELKKVGFDVKLEILEFQTMIQKFQAQTFDASMLFFGGFNPTNPDDQKTLFTATGDVVGSGFNVSSYDDPSLAALYDQARTVPGCDQAKRQDLYNQIQAKIMQDIPWFFVNTSLVPAVAQPDLKGWDPNVNSLSWNIYGWSQVPH